MADIIITQEEFFKFREFFYRKTGIQFEETKRYFVDKRLVERIQATNSETFRNYFVMVRFEASGKELQTLTNLMTVNETYFFREEYQFKSLVSSILPEITAQKRGNRPIKIWSVPSSSGEEPYSIAIYLLEHWPGITQWDVEIISSDIDTRIIDQALQGQYSSRSVQYIPKPLLEKYFTTVGDCYQICDELRQAVDFTRVNLMNPGDILGYRDFDIIFCRNLLIYFDDLSRRQTAETFFEALNPGGFICLGHSESMSRISSLFQVRKFPHSVVYQKPMKNAPVF